MKTINSLLSTAIILASLSPSTASQLRANWRVTYDTTGTCRTGTVVATIQRPSTSSTSQGQKKTTTTSVVYGTSAPYSKTVSVPSNGPAKITVPLAQALKAKSSTLSCTLQIGTKIQKVTCPTLPKCTLAPTSSPTPIEVLAPTSSPTPNDAFLAPTSSPTSNDAFLAPTGSPTHIDVLAPTSAPTASLSSLWYDVTMKSGPVDRTAECSDAYLTVTVLQKGKPVVGATVDLLVKGNASYNPSGITNAKGQVTLYVMLDSADEGRQLWTSLAVANPKYPSGSQQYVPTLNFGC